MHGFDPHTMPEMKASFFAAGPDILPGKTVRPFENVNLYPWLAHLLGLTPPKTDGSLNILAGTLRDGGAEQAHGKLNGAVAIDECCAGNRRRRNAHARCDCCRRTSVLAFAENGSIKRLRVGAEVAEANLRAILTDVFEQSGMKDVDAASVGVASATMPGVSGVDHRSPRRIRMCRSEVVGDEVIALDAAFKGGPGILQIAGTGSNCIGRAPDGSRETAGGWSSRLGDEGSGYWIGLHAIRRALNAHDREEPTRVLEAVGRIWGTHYASTSW